MKKLLLALSLALSTVAFSQELSWETPIVRVNEYKYELIDINSLDHPTIKVTRYDENEIVRETGTYVNGLQSGVWNLYDTSGNIITSLLYRNGERIWLKTTRCGRDVYVEYRNNKPLEVTYRLASN